MFPTQAWRLLVTSLGAWLPASVPAQCRRDGHVSLCVEASAPTKARLLPCRATAGHRGLPGCRSQTWKPGLNGTEDLDGSQGLS